MSGALTRAEAEDFLFHEAELLDAWMLDAWVALYTEDAVYEVTSPSSDEPRGDDPAATLFLIADRIGRIRGRATRLGKKSAHAEYPHSKTRHLVSNVRARPGNGAHEGAETAVRANFAVYRTKEDATTVYMGEYDYRLVRGADGIRIRAKRASLDLNSLYDQGRLTILL
jgi:p-cumate 2,3-dioxygenase beta subunit